MDVAGAAARMEPGQGRGGALVGGELQGSVRLGPGRAGERAAQLGRFQTGPPRRRPCRLPTPQAQGPGSAGVPVHDRRDPGGARPSPCNLAPPRAAQDPRVDKEAGPSAGAGNRADPGGHDQPAGRPLVCVVHLPGATGRAAPPPASGNRRGGCRGRAAGGAVQRRADRQPPAAHRCARQAGPDEPAVGPPTGAPGDRWDTAPTVGGLAKDPAGAGPPPCPCGQPAR